MNNKRFCHISLLLSLVLALSLFAGCGSRKNEEEEPPEAPSQSEPEPEPIPQPDPEPEIEDEPEDEPEPEDDRDAEEPQPAPQPEDNNTETDGNDGGEGVQQAAASVNIANLPEEFRFTLEDVSKFCARSYSNYTYTRLTNEQAQQVFPLMQKAAANTPEELYSVTQGGFYIQLKTGEKFSYTLNPSSVRINNNAYPLSDEDYEILVGLCNEINSTGTKYVQWLLYMTPANVQSIEFYTSSGTTSQTLTGEAAAEAAGKLANITVANGDAYDKLKDMDNAPGASVISLTFASGIKYQMLVEDGKLYIQSSDMTYGCVYSLTTSQSSIDNTLRNLA